MLGKTDHWCFNQKQSSKWVLILEAISTVKPLTQTVKVWEQKI